MTAAFIAIAAAIGIAALIVLGYTLWRILRNDWYF